MLKYIIITLVGIIMFVVGFIIQKMLVFEKVGLIIIFALTWHWSLILYIGLIIAVIGVLGILIYEE